MHCFADYVHKLFLVFKYLCLWFLTRGCLFSCSVMHKINTGLLYVYFIISHDFTSLNSSLLWCNVVTGLMFLGALVNLISNLLPCLSWKFGTHFFNLAVLLWNLQRFGQKVEDSLYTAEATSKAYYSYDHYQSFLIV